MRKIILGGVFFLSCYSAFTIAATQNIICEEPQGTRVDYFITNTLNLQNQTFLMGRDRVSGMQPRLSITDDHKNVYFTIGDTAAMARQTQTANMQVLAADENQISFAGLVNSAPILATYYPKMRILIYSQQSIWPGTELNGARAVVFYAKCTPQTVSYRSIKTKHVALAAKAKAKTPIKANH